MNFKRLKLIKVISASIFNIKYLIIFEVGKRDFGPWTGVLLDLKLNFNRSKALIKVLFNARICSVLTTNLLKELLSNSHQHHVFGCLCMVFNGHIKHN